MYQPTKEKLHTCNTEIEKIGHNLDSSNLSYSVEDNCERQISFSASLPQTRNNCQMAAHHHTTHFETLPALSPYLSCAPTFTIEKTILKDVKKHLVFNNNINTTVYLSPCFQSDPEFTIKEQIIISKGTMVPFET